MTFENEVWTYAEQVRGVKLRDVLTRVRDFLSDNPTEIVIVHVTNDRKSVDWTACHVIIQELFRDRLIPEHMKDLTIGEFRGRKFVPPSERFMVKAIDQKKRSSYVG